MNGLFEGTGRVTQSWVPTLDAWETEDALVFAFDLPGEGDGVSYLHAHPLIPGDTGCG